ncbi:hypothetical protein BS47DRAFT_1373376 [Hydnum rufescens UP504]|uniref:AB hydrolase-1 domain-containing protein n=1 Tax=Hydnum rufescens UP504 TaxID=1448309 RepID=A0A9P6DTX2_9AGAM|nr:hypothetical protein BS47DRAFT_1373376 [Hydnum rufescens UP504]
MSSSHESFPISRFDTFDITIETVDPSKSVTIHGVTSKNTSLPALLLLHGHPQTHHIWKTLGHETFYLVGHDRGGRVAHRLALDYPEAVIKMIVLDIAPTLAMYEQTGHDFATVYWHWFFLIQPAPLPEELILASPLAYLKRGGLDKPSEVFSRPAIESYHANFSDPACVHAMCEDYRASAPRGIDLTLDQEDISVGRRIKAPFMVLWGLKGVIEALFDCKKEWGRVCEGTVHGRSVPTGHFIPEG